MVSLDETMTWLLGVRKTNGLGSVADKHPRASVRVVLQLVTRSLACEPRMVEMKATHVAGACGRDGFEYALASEREDEQLVSLHQAMHHGNSEEAHAYHDGEQRDVRQSVRESRMEDIGEIHRKKERASVAGETIQIIRRIIISLKLMHLATLLVMNMSYLNIPPGAKGQVPSATCCADPTSAMYVTVTS